MGVGLIEHVRVDLNDLVFERWQFAITHYFWFAKGRYYLCFCDLWFKGITKGLSCKHCRRCAPQPPVVVYYLAWSSDGLRDSCGILAQNLSCKNFGLAWFCRRVFFSWRDFTPAWYFTGKLLGLRYSGARDLVTAWFCVWRDIVAARYWLALFFVRRDFVASRFCQAPTSTTQAHMPKTDRSRRTKLEPWQSIDIIGEKIEDTKKATDICQIGSFWRTLHNV